MTSNTLKIEELVKLYSNDIYNLAYNITATKQDAEDATQNTFIQVYQNLSKFRGESSIFTWIYKIALNESLKIARKIKLDASHFKQVDSDIEDLKDSIPDEIIQLRNNPEKELIYKAFVHEIKEGCHHFMLFRITEEQRIVFIFRILLGFSINEISAILEIDENVVKSRFSRAKENLKKHVTDRCQWYNKKSSCTCEKCIGFALQMTLELKNIISEAANSPEYYKMASEKIDQIEDIETMFKRLPKLEYKISTLNFIKNSLS